MASSQRPWAPFMMSTPPLTAVRSIIHRMTGMFLSSGTLVLVYWLIAAASGPEAYAVALYRLDNPLLLLLFLGWSFSFFYHLCNGIRHLFWDIGRGFEISQVYASGWTVVIATFVMWLGFWFLLWDRLWNRIGGVL